MASLRPWPCDLGLAARSCREGAASAARGTGLRPGQAHGPGARAAAPGPFGKALTPVGGTTGSSSGLEFSSHWEALRQGQEMPTMARAQVHHLDARNRRGDQHGRALTGKKRETSAHRSSGAKSLGRIEATRRWYQRIQTRRARDREVRQCDKSQVIGWTSAHHDRLQENSHVTLGHCCWGNCLHYRECRICRPAGCFVRKHISKKSSNRRTC